MWILAERGDAILPDAGPDEWLAFARAIDGGPPVAFVTRFGRHAGALEFEARAMVLADGRLVGTLGDGSTDARAAGAAIEQMARGPAARVALGSEAELLVEPVLSRPKLAIAGGGHVAKAVARQAQLVGFDVTVFEDRPEFADPGRFEGATVVGGDIAAAIAAFDFSGQSFLVVATRGHKLDADCVLAAVRTPVRYIGLLGSRRKTVLIADALREAGVGEERIAAVHAPVGLDLGGRTPAEIALAVLAEITQIRYGGTGRPLRER
jgi:xanthine dehydrogenase accessory factor